MVKLKRQATLRIIHLKIKIMKNLKKLKFLSLISACVVLLFSCEKEELFSPEFQERNIASSERIATDDQLDSVAILHNLYTSMAISAIDYSTSNFSTELYEVFDSIGMSEFGYNNEEVESFLINPDSNYSILSNNIENSLVTSLINNVREYFTQDTSLSYNDIHNYLSAKIDYAYATLSGSDLDITLCFLKTCDKSCYLWLPTSKGGLGAGNLFISNLDEEDIQNLPGAVNWSLIGWADGAGAARSLYLLWIGSAGGPIGWGAAASAIGWSAAYASGATLVGQLLLL